MRTTNKNNNVFNGRGGGGVGGSEGGEGFATFSGPLNEPEVTAHVVLYHISILGLAEGGW